MRKMLNKKGFTLAELLIVVAIIAVLVAIAIPIFTTQLEKSREATDMANIRAAYADIMSEYLLEPADYSITVPAKQTVADWQNTECGKLQTLINGSSSQYTVTAKISGDYTVAITKAGVFSVS